MAPSTSIDGAAVMALRAQRVKLARTDPATFAELVIRDEQTAVAVSLAPMHEDWHRLVDAHPRLVLHAHVESGKSSALTIGRTLWELGRDPTKRIAILSNTATQARKFLSSVARYITRSSELREVFPHLLPGQPWGADSITVARPTISKDPSVQALGVHGNVLGARLDLVVMDDVLDFENTRTDDQRRQLIEWVYSTLLGRLTASGRVLVLGSAWHPHDLMHVLATNGWHSARYGVEDDEGRPRWPSRWSIDRIAAKRVELGPLEAARQLDCLARADETSRFREEWLVAAAERGAMRAPLDYILNVPPGYFTVAGVDLAVSSKSTADRSAIAVALVHPNGHRELLSVESGRWDAPTIIRRIASVNERYQPLCIVVESVAAQRYISQMLRELSTVPVRDFNTGRGKMSLQYQSEALPVELSNHKWTLRGGNTSEVAALVRDMLYYDPRSHCGDRLVALLLARWGADQTGFRVEHPALDFNRR